MNLQDQEELYLKAKKAYYDGEPIMEDFEFDELEQELKEVGSDVINVVGDDRTTRYPHWSSVLSLAKISADLLGNPPTSEFESWYQGLIQKLGLKTNIDVEFSPKFDGNSLNLQYRGGKLYMGLTRGNEKGGKDITAKAKHFVPLTIPYLEDCEIRGEVMIPLSVFEKKFAQNFKNPRNYVAGVLNRDDLDMSGLDDMVFIAYNFRKYDGGSKFISNEIDFIDSLGFNPVFKFPRFTSNDPKSFSSYFDQFTQIRQNLEYGLDGIVVSVKNAEQRAEIGENGHDPDYALAVKFPPKQAKTTILDIEWNISNFGEMVPVALLKPVDLDGSTVKRASLASWGNLKNKKCYPGAEVIIAKAGDIIPHIYSVVKEGNANFQLPTICTCGTPFTIDDKHITCENVLCEQQVKRRFRGSMGILGYYNFGGSTMNEFYSAGFRTPADFFSNKMTKQYLINTGVFTQGRYLDRLFEELEKIKELPLEKLINCFKFNGVGRTASRELAKQYAGQEYSFSNLEKAPLEGFDDLTNPKRILLDELINNLKTFGVKVVEPKTIVGIGVELTGSPKGAGFSTKEAFLAVIEPYGYVNKKLKESQFLITDDIRSTSGKMKAAQKQGATIITYENFIKQYCSVEIISESETATPLVERDSVKFSLKVSEPKTTELF